MLVYNYLSYNVYPGVGLGSEKTTNYPGAIMQGECVVGCIACDLI